METTIGVAFVLLLAGLVLAWTLLRAREVRERWAEQHGFDLLEARYCWFWRGPFLFRSTDAQLVYRVTVRDRSGRRRTGWLRCGGFFLGLFG